MSPLFHRMIFNEVGKCGSVIVTYLRLLVPTPSFSSSELEICSTTFQKRFISHSFSAVELLKDIGVL